MAETISGSMGDDKSQEGHRRSMKLVFLCLDRVSLRGNAVGYARLNVCAPYETSRIFCLPWWNLPFPPGPEILHWHRQNQKVLDMDSWERQTCCHKIPNASCGPVNVWIFLTDVKCPFTMLPSAPVSMVGGESKKQLAESFGPGIWMC